MSEGSSERKRGSLLAILQAGAMLIVALGANWLLARHGTGWFKVWVGPVLVPLWFALTSVWFLRRHGYAIPLHRGGGHLRLAALLTGLMLVWLVVWAILTGSDSTDPELRPALWGQFILVFWVPLGEELYFRGVLLGMAQRPLGRAASVLGVSLLFGALHPWGVSALVMVGLSLVLSWSVIRTGTLLWAVAIHTAWNGLSGAWMEECAGNRFWLLVLTSLALSALIARGLATRERVCPSA